MGLKKLFFGTRRAKFGPEKADFGPERRFQVDLGLLGLILGLKAPDLGLRGLGG